MSENKTKFCYKCQLSQSIDNFAKNRRKLDGLQTYCKTCMFDAFKLWLSRSNNCDKQKQKSKSCKKQRIKENQQKLIDFLLKNPCVDCGFNDILALEFDHVRGKKFGEIPFLIKNGNNWKTIEEEISKCQILCANCHRIKTHKECNTFRYRFFNFLNKQIDK